MKIDAKQLCLFVMMSTAVGLWTPGQVRAQDSTSRRADDSWQPVDKAVQSMQQMQHPAARQNSPYALDPFYAGPKNSPSRAGSGAIRKAAEAVRDAKGDEAKSAAQKKLADLLNKSYDEDMAQRERELKQIEERLTKLRELLSRRRSKKQEIIDLQIKVALNDADGLGFYENERPPKNGIDMYYYAPIPALPPVAPVPRPTTSSLVPTVNASTGTSGVEASVGPAPSSAPEPTPFKDVAR